MKRMACHSRVFIVSRSGRAGLDHRAQPDPGVSFQQSSPLRTHHKPGDRTHSIFLSSQQPHRAAASSSRIEQPHRAAASSSRIEQPHRAAASSSRIEQPHRAAASSSRIEQLRRNTARDKLEWTAFYLQARLLSFRAMPEALRRKLSTFTSPRDSRRWQSPALPCAASLLHYCGWVRGSQEEIPPERKRPTKRIEMAAAETPSHGKSGALLESGIVIAPCV